MRIILGYGFMFLYAGTTCLGKYSPAELQQMFTDAELKAWTLFR